MQTTTWMYTAAQPWRQSSQLTLGWRLIFSHYLIIRGLQGTSSTIDHQTRWFKSNHLLPLVHVNQIRGHDSIKVMITGGMWQLLYVEILANLSPRDKYVQWPAAADWNYEMW